MRWRSNWFICLQGFVPGMFGVSHGALQFMTYEEMKNAYNEYRKLPIDTKLVRWVLIFFFIRKWCICHTSANTQCMKSRRRKTSEFSCVCVSFVICLSTSWRQYFQLKLSKLIYLLSNYLCQHVVVVFFISRISHKCFCKFLPL